MLNSFKTLTSHIITNKYLGSFTLNYNGLFEFSTDPSKEVIKGFLANNKKQKILQNLIKTNSAIKSSKYRSTATIGKKQNQQYSTGLSKTPKQKIEQAQQKSLSQKFKHQNNINNKKIQINGQNQTNFLKKNKKLNNQQVRTVIPNPQRFLLYSQFQRQGIDLEYTVTQINRFNNGVIDDQTKFGLIKLLKEIKNQRDDLLRRGFSLTTFKQQYKIYMQKDQTCLIQQYIALYQRISQSVQNILNASKRGQDKSLALLFSMLHIIKRFDLKQFYDFYIIRLMDADQVINSNKLSRQQAEFSMFIIDMISQVDCWFEHHYMPYDMQNRSRLFFQTKLVQILKIYQDMPLNKKIECLTKIQKIFSKTHLNYEKHYFYVKFVQQNIQILRQKITESRQQKIQNVDLVLDFFALLVKNSIFDQLSIKILNKLLEKMAKSYKIVLNDSARARKLIQIYEHLGSIPPAVYEKMVAKLAVYYSKNVQDYKNLIRIVKFYVCSECRDFQLLNNIVSSLQKLLKSQDLSNCQKQMHMLHYFIHYLCLKDPHLPNHLAIDKILRLCESHSTKDHYVLKQIIRNVKEKTSEASQNLYSTSHKNLFVSECILMSTTQFGNTKQKRIKTLQEQLFQQRVKVVINQINSGSDTKGFYEVKEKFSFCGFEIDCIALRWDSRHKNKLVSYMDIECMGIQYTYDKFQQQTDEQMSRKVNSMSLINYEKGLKLSRKKQVRAQILNHYGFKILNIPNKFLYNKLIERRDFQLKLKQAILQKLAD